MQSQVAASAAIVARCLSPSSTELATFHRADSRGAQHSGLKRDAGTADAEANVIKWQLFNKNADVAGASRPLPTDTSRKLHQNEISFRVQL